MSSIIVFLHVSKLRLFAACYPSRHGFPSNKPHNYITTRGETRTLLQQLDFIKIELDCWSLRLPLKIKSWLLLSFFKSGVFAVYMTHHDTFGRCQCHSGLVRKMKLTAKKPINMIPSSLSAFCWLTSKLSWFYWHLYRLSSKLFRLFGWTSCMQMEVSWNGGAPKSSTLIFPL